MVVDTFQSTEINFGPISTHEGSIPVSETVLVRFQGSQVTSGVKKSVWVNSLVTRDHARTIISESSQGSPGTKIALKTDLEGVIRLRNERIARAVSRRWTKSPHLTPIRQILTEISINLDSGVSAEIQDFCWDFRCHRLLSWTVSCELESIPHVLCYNFLWFRIWLAFQPCIGKYDWIETYLYRIFLN